MKFTLSWLKDHLETDASLDQIVEKLSMIGLEVEGVENRAAELAPFRVAYVKEAVQHPDADRLRVCTVQTDQGDVQVVCGAPNARTGMYGVFAPVGSYVPGIDLTLKAGTIRGVDSNGMLVSEREMGLSDEHDGIIDLSREDGSAPADIGTPFAGLVGLDDPMIEIAITPNRGDCLGVRGIAQDLVAAGMGTLKPLNIPDIEGSFDSPLQWQRDLPADKQAAQSYVQGRYFRGVKNGPSPQWMQNRLVAIGLRPISALVDITNYVTFDLGRPLHVFDADKVVGNPTMRFAKEGEEIVALDGKNYKLDPETLIIADDNGPEAIGGIMGGELSGCTEETVNVFLEAALFDPVMIALTGRRLGINSDARYRFERGVDPSGPEWGVDAGAMWIQKLCGGEVSHRTIAGEEPNEDKTITLRKSRVESLGGVALDGAKQAEILENLGFAVEDKGDSLSVTVPGRRPDIEGEACLVEEVLRIYGYDHLPMTPVGLDGSLPHAVLTLAQRRVSAVRTALVWSGLNEAVSFSFISEKQARAFGWDNEATRLENPISSDLDVMRPSILPVLLQAAQRNADKGFPDVGLFEIGPQYSGITPQDQASVAAALRAGKSGPRHWDAIPRPVDAFDAKADALKALEVAGAPVENLQVFDGAPSWYHPGRSGTLRMGPKMILANFGELHPGIVKAFGLEGRVAAMEVFLDNIPSPKVKKGKKASKMKAALKISPFMPVERDFAFLVDADFAAEKLIRAAKGADKALIDQVSLFDDYRGKGVPEGKKSLAIAVTLQPKDKTLTDEELEAVSQKVVTQVIKASGGELRG
ncbi:phenylalanine--tRNA ligase subunit beta [Rhodovibrionaceae bacterium A322]